MVLNGNPRPLAEPGDKMGDNDDVEEARQDPWIPLSPELR